MDDDIRAALRSGDTNAAFRMLVHHHGAAVYTRCCRMLKSRGAAEDAMQQTMIAAFQRRDQLLAIDQIRGWLIRVAVRKCLDALRSSKRIDRLQRDFAPGPEAEAADLLAQLGSTQDRRGLEECLASLPPAVAAAILMRYRDDMPWDQIADAVEMAPDAIRMQVARTIERHLRPCLASKAIVP